MAWKHSQSQQNQQDLGAPARLRDELRGLLQAAAGEQTGSLHSALGRWRQRVGEAIFTVAEEAFGTSGGGAAAGTRTFAQASYVETEFDDGPGQPSVVTGTDIVFDAAPFGTIPYDNTTGVFTLAANKTYRLTANMLLDSFAGGDGTFAKIEWVNAGTNLALRGGTGTAVCYPVTGANATGPLPVADILFTTGAAPVNVKVRVTDFGLGDTADVLFGSNAIVVEA